MIHPFHYRKILLTLFALLLTACDPSFETTADLCASGEDNSVTIGLDFSDPDVSPYTIVASRENGDYRLFLQDILEAAEPADPSALSAQEQLALDTLKQFINGDGESELNLQYEQISGVVTQTSNPLDYIEALIATTDRSQEIGAFEDARAQVARGIRSDDGFCVYSNPNIRFVDENGENVLFAELSLSYDPFSKIVQQSFLISELRQDLSSSSARATVPYFSFTQAFPEDYKERGAYPVILRQALLNSADGKLNMVMDDGNDNLLGQVELSTQNAFCTDENDDIVACDGALTTRTPAKTQCDGSDPDGEDETGTNEVRTLRLNDDYDEVKRLRIETDFDTQEVRIYASDYNEAILDSDDSTLIKDPTNCEKQAVLDELAAANPGTGVSLTVVEDPNFDIIYEDDGDGNQVVITTPIYSFTGTTIPSRDE